ncbi:uncharacterized protein METZ01_LOCUS491555, partial [marine metagenome]
MADDSSKEVKKTDEVLEIYPILPLRNTVLFPQQIIPIYVGREQSLKLIDDLPKGGKKYIVVVAQKDGSIENPKGADLYEYGTLAMVMKVFDMPDKSRSAIVQGLDRVRVKQYLEPDPYYKGLVEKVRGVSNPSAEIDGIVINLQEIFKKLIDIAPYLSEEQYHALSSIQNPGKLADKAISLMNISTKDKQEVLEELDVKNRLEKCTVLVN